MKDLQNQTPLFVNIFVKYCKKILWGNPWRALKEPKSGILNELELKLGAL